MSDHDSVVRFCDHTGWYDDVMCYTAKRDYEERPYSLENVREAQIRIANSLEELEKLIESGEIDRVIDKYELSG